MSNKYKHGKYRISIADDKDIQNKVVSITDDKGNDALGGGSIDISGKADKVSNSTNGNLAGLDSNGNLTDSGKKASDFATSSQGAKADTAYQKPQSGIPESDLSSDVQQALQKRFKGWYASSSSLPANPVVGDYAYVKGAETTDPAAIYECTTDGSWSDSGRTADTSNVQTFASNQEVNEVHIVNDLTTGGSDDVLSAEQGKEIGNCLLDNYFIGQGTTYASVKIKGLASGRKYRLVKEIIQHTDVTPGGQLAVFGIYAYHSDSSYNILVNILTPQGLLRYYDFIVPNDTEYIEVGGRANSGVKVRFIVYDITEINDIVSTQSSMQQEISLLRTGSVKNCISNTKLGQEDGKTISAEGIVTSDYIQYTSGNSVEWKYSSSSETTYRICFYNSLKEYINGAFWRGANSSGKITISSSDINTYAPNAAFIRANFTDGYLNGYIKIGENIVYQPIFETIDGIETLRHDLDSITSDSVVSLNAFKKSAINSIAIKIGSQTPKLINNYFCVVHISDVHGDSVRYKRMVDFVNELDNVSCIICTGDYNRNDYTDNGFESTYGQYYNQSKVPMLPVIGNHDVGSHTIIAKSSTIEEDGERYITPYINSFGGIQGGTNAGYYYKDFDDFKVRVIVLNEYEMPRIQNGTNWKYSVWGRYLSQAQANWFVNTLNSVGENWSVVVCMHQLIDVFDKYDNEFKGRVPYSNADITNAQGTIIQDIVDAYISKSTLNKSYTVSGADTTEVPVVSVNADFTSAQGEFVCYLNGHTHNDGIGQSSVATNKQVNVNVTCGSANVNSIAVYDDLYRKDDDISQDAFNMVAIAKNSTEKEIRILRIGANVSADMRRRDYACVSYSQS